MKKERGITLIALVITIIVLLILAGVTINLTLGQNGIFTTAQKAAKNYTEAQEKELAYLEGFTNQVNNIVNPEPLGTIIKTENGVNYIADGAGNTIPVPVGFRPITTEDQGTKATGFVIKNDTDGNEFVWVPVDKYERIAWTRDGWTYTQATNGIDETTKSTKITRADLDANTDYWTEKMPIDEQSSVNNYGGFYIGRYEAGIKDGVLSSSTVDGTTWTGYTGGVLVVQANQQVWNYITRDGAEKEAGKLYNKEENNVTSKLCSSYAWDSALKFIGTKNSTYPTNSVGGNYIVAIGDISELKDTGYDKAHPCNIYDMGGNVWEWTTETYSNISYACVKRGGDYGSTVSSDFSAAFRYSGSDTNANNAIGFRVVLFI